MLIYSHDYIYHICIKVYIYIIAYVDIYEDQYNQTFLHEEKILWDMAVFTNFIYLKKINESNII